MSLSWHPHTGIDRLVTLGSPHNPPPQGVLDQTRGILTHVQQTCPGNFHQEVSCRDYIPGLPLTSPLTQPCSQSQAVLHSTWLLARPALHTADLMSNAPRPWHR